MVDVNGNSDMEEIISWIENKNKELKNMVNEAENNPSGELTIKAKTMMNNAKALVKEKIKIMEEEKDENKDYFKSSTDKLLNEMEKSVSTIMAKEGTENDASFALSQLMNDSTFKEIQEIEKQILYRKFYFPGGIPKLRVVGNGVNKKTDEFEYDGTEEGSDKDPFDHWDPRYLKEYVMEAKQNSFHKNFIYYNGIDYKTMNFYQAANVLKKCVNWSTGKIEEDGACDKYEVTGILGGLKYFDKINSFLESNPEVAGGKMSLFNKVYVINGDLINLSVEKLESFIQQSEKEFKENNFGWMANSNKFAFDSAQYLERWMNLEKKYEEYKDRVWKILEGTNMLQLCTNNVNVTGNNISIQQEMSCIQKVMKDNDGGGGGDGSGGGDGENETIKKYDEKKNETIKKKEEEKNGKKDENMSGNKSPLPPTNEEEKKKEYLIYVIVGVLVLIILGISLYLIFKPVEMRESENVDMNLNN